MDIKYKYAGLLKNGEPLFFGRLIDLKGLFFIGVATVRVINSVSGK